jgi:hypothetical protein
MWVKKSESVTHLDLIGFGGVVKTRAGFNGIGTCRYKDDD